MKITKIGTLNHDTPDLSELMSRRILESEAFCTSHRCTKGLRAVRVIMPKCNDYCPNCGHAVKWMTKHRNLL